MDAKTCFIEAEGGRKIGVYEAGDPRGLPVVVLHGAPGSGLLYRPWIGYAEERGIRLIGYDRPGYGESTPSKGRKVASAAGDVASIARGMKLDRLLVLGMSGGGPHALACAALLPDLVAAAATMGCPAPYGGEGLDWLAGMGQGNVEEFGAALEGDEALSRYIEEGSAQMLAASARDLAAAMSSLICPRDAEAMGSDFGDFMVGQIRGGLAKRCQGWIDDDAAFTRDWGFEPARIAAPVLLMHGREDKMVPCAHGQWLAKRVPGAELELLPEEGHLSLFRSRVPEALEWLRPKLEGLGR